MKKFYKVILEETYAKEIIILAHDEDHVKELLKRDMETKKLMDDDYFIERTFSVTEKESH